MMEPIAEAAAVPEPEIAPKSMFATAFVCARAPGMLPTKSFARLIRRIAIPPLFIRLPARMKNGIASRLNTEIPEKIRCAPVRTATFKSRTGRIAQMEDTASATAIGIPPSNITTRTARIIRPHTTAIELILLFLLLLLAIIVMTGINQVHNAKEHNQRTTDRHHHIDVCHRNL